MALSNAIVINNKASKMQKFFKTHFPITPFVGTIFVYSTSSSQITT